LNFIVLLALSYDILAPSKTDLHNGGGLTSLKTFFVPIWANTARPARTAIPKIVDFFITFLAK
jgi:hypothetical protein